MSNKPYRKVKRTLTKDEEWISASSTRNYAIKDPILDYLGLYFPQLMKKHPELAQFDTGSTRVAVHSANRDPAPLSKTKEYDFSSFLKEQGHKFESAVITGLYRKFDKSQILSLGGEFAPRDPGKFLTTIEAMKKATPIIYSGVLHHEERRTFGIPDLLVRSDYLNRLVKEPVLSDEEASRGAPRLGLDNYHYVVVDIKFCTLNLTADGIHVRNAGSVRAFKAQLQIYNAALAAVQGYDPCKAYLLGRRYKYTQKRVEYEGKSCFDRLGTIDYSGRDAAYNLITEEAIHWLRTLKREGHLWDPLNNVEMRKELYANMCNSEDGAWGPVKTYIARNTYEITMGWMVGCKQRELALLQGICSWMDERCTSEVLGFKPGSEVAKKLDAIFAINRQLYRQGLESNRAAKKQKRSRKASLETESDTFDKVRPQWIGNNIGNWQTPTEMELFVDFETITDVADDLKSMPNVGQKAMIFMIGVGYIDPRSGEWTYVKFLAKELTLDEEFRICKEFAHFVSGLDDKPIYHWSNAEPSVWEAAYKRQKNRSSEAEFVFESVVLNWIDLMSVIKTDSVCIYGCFGYGLKEVANSLHNLGLIATQWPKGVCCNGNSAMIYTIKAAEEASLRGLTLDEMPVMTEICKYNEVDCKAMSDIITYFRQNHTR